MADAVQYDIMLAVQTGLRALTFSAQGSESISTIDDDAIVFGKSKGKRGNRKTPGWLISPGNRIVMQADDGENNRDNVLYPFLCQLLVRDQGDDLLYLRTVMKWLEQACKTFRSQDIGVSTISGAEGGVTWNCEATTVYTVDERLWVRDEWFVAGVELRFAAMEPRGA